MSLALPPVPFVSGELGNSVIYDEYKGNYRKAERIAEQRLDRARRLGEPGQLADALLARGIVHLLAGEPTPAIACFAEVDSVAPFDFARQLRAFAYGHLATISRFNHVPGRSGAAGIEIQWLWDGVEFGARQDQRWAELTSRVNDPAVLLEAHLVYNLIAPSYTLRSIVEDSGNRDEQIDEQTKQMALASPVQFLNLAEQAGAWQGIRAYPEWVAADLQMRMREVEPAREILQHAYATYVQSGDAAGAAMCQTTWGDWIAAPFSAPEAWNMAIRVSSSEGSNLSWTVEAREFQRHDVDAIGALSAYSDAERLFRQANAPRGVAAIHLRRGYLATLGEDYQAALEHILQAQQGFEESGDRLGYWTARAHYALGRVGAGQLPEEIDIANDIGAWSRADGSFSFGLGLGLLFGRAARRWLVRDGDYERALACYRLASSLYTALGAVTNAAQSLTDQGTVYKVVGERRMAMMLYERASDSYEQTIATQPESTELITRAVMLALELYNLHLQDMDADGMERSAERMQRLGKLLPFAGASASSPLGAGASLLASALQGGFSNLSEQMDKFVSASMAWTLNQLIVSQVEQASVLAPLYRAYRARASGDVDAAARLFDHALGQAREASPDQRHFLEANVLAQMERYDDALTVFKGYLSAGGANAGFAGTLASVLALVGGEAGKAEARKQQERTHELAFTMMVRCKAFKEAKPHLLALEQSAGKEWWAAQDRPWLSLSDIAEFHEGLGQFDAALEHYDRAIDELEARRSRLSRAELKTALAADKGVQYLYFLAARCALKLHESASQAGTPDQARAYAGKAFGYIEQGKARALLDLMAGSAALATSPGTESEPVRAWRQITTRLTTWSGLLAHERAQREPDPERLAYLSQQVEADEANLRQIEVRLAASDPNFFHAVSPRAAVMSLDEVRDSLPQGTVLLQYCFVGKELISWAISREGMISTQRADLDASELEQKIRSLHRACEAHGDTRPLGEELAGIFLDPFTNALQAHQRLIIVPYGAGHSLPFHVLPWEGQPLGTSHVVSYLPSVSALQFLSQSTSGLAERLLAIGNPSNMTHIDPFDQQRTDVSPLPAAATEAALVASMFAQGEALLGEAATESAVLDRLGDYPLLHFATHGYLSEEAPLLSSLLLADGDALTVYELMGQQLNADLVVLSACNTARGETTRGDDVLGLIRGLLGAGARSAIVSLWPVNDVSTSLLMARFYRRLREGDSPAVALQAAQEYLRNLTSDEIQAEIAALDRSLDDITAGNRTAGVDTTTRDTLRRGLPTTARDYRHPYYWAPFVLVG